MQKERSVFVGCIGGLLDDILGARVEHSVNNANGVRRAGMTLQFPANRHRRRYVKAKANVPHRTDNMIAIRHLPGELAAHDPAGNVIPLYRQATATERETGFGPRALQRFPSQIKTNDSFSKKSEKSIS
ncbi:MAG TPA: hypothetical protein PLB97_03700 [Accumulibacter sp.]|nr:hypothetical protein [Accumulibacter sp.]